ncbi:hypothetical protein SESBI_32094 [Sesbania bispinosa]|nr:hypothetical protein SESBI_32094 [Sesbania bispinosa]
MSMIGFSGDLEAAHAKATQLVVQFQSVCTVDLSALRPLPIDVQGVQAAHCVVYLIQPFDG